MEEAKVNVLASKVLGDTERHAGVMLEMVTRLFVREFGEDELIEVWKAHGLLEKNILYR